MGNKSKEELDEIYSRHKEPVTTAGFTRRDFIIFETGLKLQLKSVSKLATQERKHFGAGNFSELEEYLEHLQRKVSAALENMELHHG